jgi:hypothetical protein
LFLLFPLLTHCPASPVRDRTFSHNQQLKNWLLKILFAYLNLQKNKKEENVEVPSELP